MVVVFCVLIVQPRFSSGPHKVQLNNETIFKTFNADTLNCKCVCADREDFVEVCVVYELSQ